MAALLAGRELPAVEFAPVARGGSRRLRLDLTAKDRRRLARPGRLAVELRVSVAQPGARDLTFGRRLTLLGR